MRIKEVIEKTGLSRRTIQFYISQKLIMPKEDPVNGYHDFSEEDVRNLIIISRLRRLDFPVSDIRHILRFPGTASYYFYRQIDTLTKRMDTMRRNVDILARYFENDPAPIDCDSLAASLRLMESYEEKKAAADDFTELDKRIIPLFIWTPYLSGTRSEYQEFIWSKISRKVIEDYQPFLRSMKYIISALTPEQLTYSSEKTAQQAEIIASLKHDSLPAHAACMLEQIDAFLRNSALVEKWNLVYPPLIYPLLTIGYSELSSMMFELNSDYERFYNNICVLCGLIWNLLQTTEHGTRIYEEIAEKLLPINWEQNGKGELERMTVFAFSPYALLEKEDIKKLLF